MNKKTRTARNANAKQRVYLQRQRGSKVPKGRATQALRGSNPEVFGSD